MKCTYYLEEFPPSYYWSVWYTYFYVCLKVGKIENSLFFLCRLTYAVVDHQLPPAPRLPARPPGWAGARDVPYHLCVERPRRRVRLLAESSIGVGSRDACRQHRASLWPARRRGRSLRQLHSLSRRPPRRTPPPRRRRPSAQPCVGCYGRLLSDVQIHPPLCHSYKHLCLWFWQCLEIFVLI